MMSSPVRRMALAASLALTVAAVLAVPTSAKSLVFERYEWNEPGVEWSDCGPTYISHGSGHGLFTIRPGRNGDPTPFLTDNYEWDWVNTNPANGKWFSEHGNGIYKDLKVTWLYDDVRRFTAQEAGSPYTITTSDGQKIVMDRGLLRFQFDVHTKNDDDLDNDEFIDGTDELLADHGSHPRWHMTDDEYCALVNELLS